MELDPADDADDERHLPPLPPDDRLWRHPSEVAAHGLPDRSSRRPTWLTRPWAVGGLAAVTSALLTLAVVAAAGGFRDEVRTVPAVERIVMPPTTLPATAVSAGTPWTEIVARARAAVVGVMVEGSDAPPAGGIVFRSDGHVLTAHHVIHGAGRITVLLADGDRAEATLVGGDPDTDVAVVKVDRAGMPTAALGSAASLEPGHGVLVVGPPVAPATDPVVTSGVVRGLARQLAREGAAPLEDLIEADAPGPGGAGRALVDAAGAVVGITTRPAPATDGRRTLLATPVDYARSVAQQLLETGGVAKTWIGIEGSDLDAATAAHLGVRGGAVVKRVKAAGPAGEAGLAPEDVITAVNGVPVLSMGALRILLRSHRPGEAVTVAVLRGSRAWTTEVALAPRPEG